MRELTLNFWSLFGAYFSNDANTFQVGKMQQNDFFFPAFLTSHFFLEEKSVEIALFFFKNSNAKMFQNLISSKELHFLPVAELPSKLMFILLCPKS